MDKLVFYPSQAISYQFNDPTGMEGVAGLGGKSEPESGARETRHVLRLRKEFQLRQIESV